MPGINLDAPTTLFLIGNHFSVHQTRVIVGGQAVSDQEMLSRQVMKVTIPAYTQALVEHTGLLYGGWKAPPCKPNPTDPTATQTASSCGSCSDDSSDSSKTAGAAKKDGTSPNDGTSTKDGTKTKDTTPSGPADFPFVDVQLATPYGSTSHLLIPAWHLGKTGSGSTMGSTSTADSGSASDTTASATGLPAWTTDTLSLGYVYKGIGIAASDPPIWQPKTLTLNLGPNYKLVDGSTLSMSITLGGSAKGKTATAWKVDVKSGSSFDPTKPNVLTITGNDINNLATLLFTELQYQLGPAGTKPPDPTAPVTLDVSVTSPAPTVNISNKLNVKLISGASSATKTTGGTTTTPGS